MLHALILYVTGCMYVCVYIYIYTYMYINLFHISHYIRAYIKQFDWVCPGDWCIARGRRFKIDFLLEGAGIGESGEVSESVLPV